MNNKLIFHLGKVFKQKTIKGICIVMAVIIFLPVTMGVNVFAEEINNFINSLYTSTEVQSNLGTPDSNITVGYDFVPSQSISITALGRPIPAGTVMKYTHTVTVWRVSTGVRIAEVTVSPKSMLDVPGYCYELLAGAVQLESGIHYRIVSSESYKGDTYTTIPITLTDLDGIASVSYGVSGLHGVYPTTQDANAGKGFWTATFFTTTGDGVNSNSNFFNQIYTGSRNDATGVVGYQFTPSTDITVTALGRAVSTSMNNNHTLCIYKVETTPGEPVAKITVKPTSLSDGYGYKYEILGKPVVLISGQAYRIVSSETNGGDQWMNLGSVSNHKSIATVQYGVSGAADSYPNSTWGTTDQGMGPVTFYTKANLLPKNFFTDSYSSGNKTNLTKDVGYEFTPTQDITITALGRSVSTSMNQEHDISVYRVSNQKLVAAATVKPFSCTDAQGYRYETLPVPVTLIKDTAYRIVSSELNGGDNWNDLTGIGSHSSVAVINQGVQGDVGSYPSTTAGTSEQGYGPATFYFGNLQSPINLARALPANRSVLTSSSNNGSDSMFSGSGANELARPWNRVYVVDGRRNCVDKYSGWSSENNLTVNHTEWITIDMGNNTDITTVDLYPRNDSGAVGLFFPIDFEIQVSYDNTNWTTINTQTNYSQPGNSKQRITFNKIKTRYLKINCTNLRPYNGEYRVQFAEIEIFNLDDPYKAANTEDTIVSSDITVGPLVDETETTKITWNIDSEGGIIAGDEASGFTRLIRTPNTRPLTLYRQFAKQTSGILTTEFQFKVPLTQTGVEFQLRNGSMPAISLFTSGNALYYKNSSGASISMQTYSANTVYGVKIVTDLSNHTFSLYINGILKVNAAALWNSIDIDNFLIKCSYSSAWELKVSPLKIYKGYAVNDRFYTNAAGGLPGDWSSTTAGGTVATELIESSIRPDSYSLKLNDTSASSFVSATKSFSTQSGNSTTHKLVCEYKFLIPAKTYLLDLGFRSGTTSAFKISTYGGNLSSVSPGNSLVSLLDFKENVWCSVKIIADMSAHTSDIYVNGKLKATGEPFFDAGVSGIDNVIFTTNNENTGAVYVDDVFIYEQLPEPEDYVPTPNAINELSWTRINDNSTSLTYSTGVNYVSGDFNYYNNDYHSSPTAGKYMEFTFNGTGARWIGSKNVNMGKVDIKLDGITVASNVDLYSATAMHQQVLFEIQRLSSGSHTLRIEVLGTKNLSSSGTYVIMDACEYTNDYLVGMQACSLLRTGSHGAWVYVENDIDRKPVLGFYNEGDREAVDWEIKYLAEHGVDYIQYCWYGSVTSSWKSTLAPIKDTVYTGPAIENGLFNAKYSNNMKFTIMWTNYASESLNFIGTTKADAYEHFKTYVFPYWLEYYFKDERYLKIDNKPVISIFYIDQLLSDFGTTSEISTDLLGWMRTQLINEGFAGAIFLQQVCVQWKTDAQYTNAKNSGFDYIYNYAYGNQTKMATELSDSKRLGFNTIPGPGVNYSQQPWYEMGSFEGYFRDPESYGNLLSYTKNTYMKDIYLSGKLGANMVLLDNWNEMGEGHFLMPTEGLGFGYLDQIREMFTNNPSHTDLVPSASQKTRFDYLFPYAKTRFERGFPSGGSLNVPQSSIVLGDLDDDGLISILDLSAVKMYLLKIRLLTDYELLAGDIFGSGNIAVSNLLAIKKHIIGIETINQR